MPRKKNVDLLKGTINRQTSIDNLAFIQSYLDPDRVLEKLGLDAEEAFQDITVDDHLTSVMGTRLASIKGMEWDLTIGKSTDRILKACQNMLNDLNTLQQGQGMSRFFDDILQANPWGMSALEVIWQIGPTEWIPKYVKGRPFRYFTFSTENELLFRSTNNWEGEKIKDYKVLLARHWITSNSFDNPYGDKLLSKSYWPVTFKRNGIQWWQVFVEKYGMPWVTGKVPTSMSEIDREALADLLAEAVQDGVLIIPNTSEIELIEAKGDKNSNGAYENMIHYMDSALSKVWLGETLTTEIGDVGSYAAAKTHQGVKDERRDQDKKMVESTVQTLIDWFVELNFGEQSAPVFKLSPPLGVNQEMADRDKTLTEAGVKFKKTHFMKTYGLEEEDFEIRQNEIPEGEFTRNKDFLDQKAIDKMINSLDPVQLQKESEGMLKPVIALINKGDDYQSVMKNLTSTFPNMDSEQLEIMLTRAYFIAETIGRLENA